MATREMGLDKRGATIRDMFAGVAPRYDLLNHLLSAFQDVAWRRRAAEALAPEPGDPALDLCCGTGDQALALARRGARVVAADFCLPMLALARRKYGRRDSGGRPAGVAADGLALPLAGGRFAAVTVAFGLRNLADLDRGLAEIHRVLRPGGRAAFLEFAAPRRQPFRGIYLAYLTRVLPLIGKLLSPRGSAYSYLPSSILDFPQRQGFLDRMTAAGFEATAWRDLAGGAVCLYTGSRPR